MVGREDVPQFVIPTLSRAKIARYLSYPVGAEQISAALAATPQLAELGLHFYHWSDQRLRWRNYEFLRVEYMSGPSPAREWPVDSLFRRPSQDRWEVVVQPIPRILRHRIKGYIVETALPQVAQWLVERSALEKSGGDILAFFYDETSEEFVARTVTQLEPLMMRGR